MLVLVVACRSDFQNRSVSVETATSSVQCRPFNHALGQTCVPLTPKKIVSIGILEDLLALEVKPIGSAFWAGGGTNFPVFLQDETLAIASLGTETQPNIERILLLKPDLIVGFKWAIEPIYQQLSQIAPTVVFDIEYGAWKTRLKAIAELLGKSEKAELLLDTYNQHIQKFKQLMGNQLTTIQVSILRSFHDRLRIYLRESYSGGILEDAGLVRPLLQTKKAIWEDISIESLSNVDADVIFAAHDNPENSFLNSIKTHPLWIQLNAVQQNKMYEVDQQYWIGGSSVIAANLVVDDLFKFFLDQPSS